VRIIGRSGSHGCANLLMRGTHAAGFDVRASAGGLLLAATATFCRDVFSAAAQDRQVPNSSVKPPAATWIRFQEPQPARPRSNSGFLNWPAC